MEQQRQYQDRMVTHVQVRWGIIDRLRILLRGACTVRVTVQTQNEVGYTDSDSEAWAAPVFARRPTADGLHLEAVKEP